MEKNSFLKLTIACISFFVVFVPTKISNACGWYPMTEEYRVWLFQPSLGKIDALFPFYYSTDIYYGGNWMWDNGNSEMAVPRASWLKTNVNDWIVAINDKTVRPDDVDSLLYSTDPERYFDAIEKKNPSDVYVLENTFFKFLQKKGSAQYLDYFSFAKKSEELSNYDDPWEMEPRDVKGFNVLINEGLKTLRKKLPEFLVERYAYQLVKLAHYEYDEKLCSEFYEKYFEKSKTDSWLKYSALFYKVEFMKGPEYYYFLSRVFDLSIDKKERALKLFSWEGLNDILPYAKNDHERAVIYTMHELQFPGRSLKTLENIYALDPGCKELGTLISREINKTEDWLCTNKFTGMYSYFKAEEEDSIVKTNYQKDLDYAYQLKNFTEKVESEKKTKDKQLWTLACAHMELLLKNYNDCENYLAKISESDKQTQAQIRIDHLLAEVAKSDSINEKIQNEILSTIVWMRKNRKELFQYAALNSQLMLFLSEKFKGNNDIVTSALLRNKDQRPIGWYDKYEGLTNIYDYLQRNAKPNDYDRIISLMKKKNKTDFEKFLLGDYKIGVTTAYEEYFEPGWDTTFNVNRILDCKGTYFIIHDQLDSAYASFSKIPNWFWNRSPYKEYMNVNPFYVVNYEAHNHTKGDSIKYNKATYIKKMLDLKKEIAEGKNVAKNYYLLGNGYYSMTWFGNSWMMMDRVWSSSEINNSYNKVQYNSFSATYYGCDRARECYLKGMYNAKKVKMASLCAYMAGWCDRNKQLYIHQASSDYGEHVDLSSDRFVSYIEKNFHDTETYDEFNECLGLESYVASVQ